MNLEYHLRQLKCNQYSQMDEVKKSYRALSLQCHPDLNPGIDPKRFIDLTASYDFIMANHVPKKPPIARQDKNHKYYKQWGAMNKENELFMNIPTESIEEDTSIYGMILDQEFRLVLKKGTELPAKLLVKGVLQKPFLLNIIGDPE